MAQGIKTEIDRCLLESLTDQFSDTIIAEQLGCTVSTVFLNRKRHSILSFSQKTGSRMSRRSGRELKPGQGEYASKNVFDRQFFQTVDTEIKAYALGLIATDGFICYTVKGKYFGVELQKPDSKVLSPVAKAIGLEPSAVIKTLEREGKKPTERLRVHSRDLVEQLMNLGITKATGNRHCYDSLSSDLCRHYLRGIFDGDGSVDSKKRVLMLSVSSKDLAYGVANLVNLHLNIPAKVKDITRNGKPFYLIGNWNKQPKTVLDWVYSNSTIGIARKVKEANIWLSRF